MEHKGQIKKKMEGKGNEKSMTIHNLLGWVGKYAGCGKPNIQSGPKAEMFDWTKFEKQDLQTAICNLQHTRCIAVK